MTRVELHVFDPGCSQSFKQYVTDLVSARSRYCQVCLCVDDAEQAAHWRSELAHLGQVEIFNQENDVPQLPFQGEMLVSLASKITPLFSAFKQTIDLVTDTESAREDGRMRYRFYRDRGYPLRHIKVQDQESVT